MQQISAEQPRSVVSVQHHSVAANRSQSKAGADFDRSVIFPGIDRSVSTSLLAAGSHPNACVSSFYRAASVSQPVNLSPFEVGEVGLLTAAFKSRS